MCLVAPFEVSREGLVVVLCGAGPTGSCLCGGCRLNLGTGFVEATPSAMLCMGMDM